MSFGGFFRRLISAGVTIAVCAWLFGKSGPTAEVLIDLPKPTASSDTSSVSYHAYEVINQATYRAKNLPIGARWENVEGDYKDGGFSFQVWFKDDPYYLATAQGFDSNFGTSLVQHDAEEVARTVLQELLREHFDPSFEKIVLHVYANRHVLGETGKRLVIEYGHVDYDPFNDSLSYHNCDPSTFLGC